MRWHKVPVEDRGKGGRRGEMMTETELLFLKQLNTTKNGQTKAIIESRKIKIVLL